MGGENCRSEVAELRKTAENQGLQADRQDE